MSEGGRIYKVLVDPEKGDVRSLPSVTTIIRSIHSYGLERYLLRLVAELARTAPLDWTPDRILSAALDEGGAAAKAGTRQHELADFIHGAEPAPVSISERSMMNLIAAFFEQHGLEVLAREMCVASLRYGWAGRLDRVVRWTNHDTPYNEPEETTSVLDVKSGKAVQGEVALQLRAYAEADTMLVKNSDDHDLYRCEPLPEWWGEVSTEIGLVAHLRLNGDQALIPINLRLGAKDGRDPVTMLQVCRTVWEWDRYERGSVLLPAIQPQADAMSVEQIAERLGAIEVTDEAEHYRTGLWEWLRSVVAGLGDEAKQRCAARWPVTCPSFKAVRQGTSPMPNLHAMRDAELVISEAMSRHKEPFPIKERPLPPRGASLDEVPESVIAVDSPHPLDVEEFRLDWERIHLECFPKRRVPSMPSISTRKTLSHYRKLLAEYRSTHSPIEEGRIESEMIAQGFDQYGSMPSSSEEDVNA